MPKTIINNSPELMDELTEATMHRDIYIEEIGKYSGFESVAKVKRWKQLQKEFKPVNMRVNKLLTKIYG